MNAVLHISVLPTAVKLNTTRLPTHIKMLELVTVNTNKTVTALEIFPLVFSWILDLSLFA